MRKQPYAAYLNPERYQAARRNGMTNYSAFVDECISKYVDNSPIIPVNTVNNRRRER